MDAIRFPQTDAIAVAENCFDLPMAQCVSLCDRCEKGKMPNSEDCAHCNGTGYSSFRLISCWKLSPEELDIVKLTGEIWLHVCAVQTPPVLVDVHNPFEHYEGIVVLNEHLKTNS